MRKKINKGKKINEKENFLKKKKRLKGCDYMSWLRFLFAIT